MLTLRPAADLTFADLLTLWNGAYAGYFMPLVFDEAMLARHIRRSGLDLKRSVVGEVDGQPFGLSLAAFRKQGSISSAWIGGFGIIEASRRKGLATRLMGAHLKRLEAERVSETWLEVIDSNPAREVYRRCGFCETRALRMFEGMFAPGSGAGEVLSAQIMAERHAALHPEPPTWRRQLPTLMDGLTVEGATPVGVEGGYALALDQGGERLFVFDAAAVDEAAATRLLGALAARWPDLPLRLIDEPDGSPLARACEAAGLANPLNQVAMMRPT